MPEQAPPTQPYDQVGEEIRRLRHSRGMSITELAQKVGRSVGFISQIERGRSRPTVKDLYGISVQLGVQLNWFMLDRDLPPERERGVVVRANNRRKYENADVSVESLSPYLGEEAEMMLATMLPGAKTDERVVAQSGREIGFILKGRLELWLEDECFQLEEGDSYTFFRRTRHWSRNTNSEPTVVLYVLTAR